MTPLEAAGERRLRQLLFAIDLAASCAIAGIAIFLWFYKPSGQHIWYAVQRDADLVYLFMWLCIAGLGAFTARHRRTLAISLSISLLLLSEGASHAYYYHRNGRVYFPTPQAVLNRFEAHPLLVGIPHPGSFGEVSHDAQHRRTTINEGKAPNPTLIFVFGGSTAYDIGNVDAETWPSDLSRLLGQGFDVENYGVPGYTSLESMIQSLFVFRDLKPACALYYLGWNDLQDSYAEGLSNDYSDHHLPGQVGVLAVGHRPGFLENNVLLIHLIFQIFGRERDHGSSAASGDASNGLDPRLAAIFSENIRLTTVIAMHFGVKVIFVPQTMNYELLDHGYKIVLSAHIPNADIRQAMHDLNLEIERVAKESGAIFLEAPYRADWEVADFVDGTHFSASGSAKLAASIAGDVGRDCR